MTDSFSTALLAVTLAGFGATTIGAVPSLFLKNLNEKLNNNLLSFASGVMLAATIFSLLIPSIELGKTNGFSKINAILLSIVFLCLG
ncbi:MAG: hypothetical protein AAB336_01755 [Acidobacteriota bacterium]